MSTSDLPDAEDYCATLLAFQAFCASRGLSFKQEAIRLFRRRMRGAAVGRAKSARSGRPPARVRDAATNREWPSRRALARHLNASVGALANAIQAGKPYRGVLYVTVLDDGEAKGRAA